MINIRTLLFVLMLFPLLLFVTINSYSQNISLKWTDNLPPIQKEWIEIEKETFGIWENISRYQNFGAIQLRTTNLITEIDKMKSQLQEDQKNFDDKYQNFFKLSDDYVGTLRNTILQLETLLGKLDKYSQNELKYSWSEYNQDIDKYNQLVKQYHKIGDEMNVEYKKLQ